MSNGLDRYTSAFRTSNPAEQSQAWKELARHMDILLARTGGPVPGFTDAANPNPASGLRRVPALAPPAALLNVSGFDGKFVIQIANPQSILPESVAIQSAQARGAVNANQAPLLHNLQSASDINFDNSSAQFTDYGSSSQLGYMFQNANQTLFWRLRSSYDGQNWNAWQIFSSALTCGPVGVASGVLRSPNFAPNGSSNTGNFATVDSIAAGGTATIRIYGTGGVGSSWTRVISDLTGQATQNVTFAAGTITGLSYSTTYYVMWTGSSYQAFTSFNSVLPDNWIFAGKVTTVAAGGSAGTTGGGGGGGGSSGCVEAGTPVEFPEGSEVTEEVVANSDWIAVAVAGREPVNMHPDTLVSVFKRAKELRVGDLVEVDEGGKWLPLESALTFFRDGFKVKRTVKPGGKYQARGIWVHNFKTL